MMGKSHRIAGAATWTLVVDLAHVPYLQAAAGLVIAAAASHGRLSPDMDRYPWLTKVIPGGHRGITHFWLLPGLFMVGAWFARSLWWAPTALAVAWGSHITTDGVFGRIPVWRAGGKWKYWGLRFKTGGPVEYWLAVPLFVVLAAWATWGTIHYQVAHQM